MDAGEKSITETLLVWLAHKSLLHTDITHMLYSYNRQYSGYILRKQYWGECELEGKIFAFKVSFITCHSILEDESENWGGGISSPNSSEMNTGHISYTEYLHHLTHQFIIILF